MLLSLPGGHPVFAAFDDIGGENPTPKEELIDNMLDDSIKAWQQGETYMLLHITQTWSI